MSRKLTIQLLASRLAEAAECRQDEAEAFIKTVFAVVAEALMRGESVSVNGIGTFEPADGNVRFTPAPALASVINEPFAYFRPVPVGDSVTEAMLDAAGAGVPVTAGDAHSASPVEKADTDDDVHTIDNGDAGEPIEADADNEALSDETVDEAVEPEPIPTISADELAEMCRVEDDADDDRPVADIPKRHFGAAWILAAGLIAGMLIGWMAASWQIDRAGSTPVTHDADIRETVADRPDADDDYVVATQPDAPVGPDTVPVAVVAAPGVLTDTVRAGYYITNMARKYYGNKNFWSYIYEENRGRLGHPERTLPGTVVVIPPPAKYGIDASDPASVKAAKQLAYEIYGRYR